MNDLGGITPEDGRLVGGAAHGGQGADDPDGPWDRRSGFGPGFDHADHRAGTHGLQGGQAMGAGRVAGDHDELGIVALEQLAHLQRVALDGAVALGAVG